MKLGIMTFQRANNYGAVLQCYALNRALQNLGADCEVIDYSPDYFRKLYHVFPEKTFSMQGLKTLACHLLLRKMLVQRNASFDLFVGNKMKISKQHYLTLDGVSELPYDAVITGSDQVWSPTVARFDPAFFLYGDAFRNVRKYSYAASIGVKQLPEEKTEEYKRRLADYRLMSVREESAVPLVEQLVGQTPTVSCDPTFLLDADEWKAMAGDKPLVDGEYIYLYYVKQPQEIREYAKKLAKETGCKVICTSCFFTRAPGAKYHYMSGKADQQDGFVTMNAVAPDEYLNLILHAKYVLCSSFHGTVFSILFRKQFLSQTVWHDGSSNDRAANLLKLTGLSGRDICSANASIDKVEDWDAVAEKIAVLRENGHQYLNDILTDMQEA